MPCDTVSLTTVELHVAHLDTLRAAVAALGWTIARETAREIVVRTAEGETIRINRTTQQAVVTAGDEALVARLKRAYVTQGVKKEAKRYGWKFTMTDDTHFELER